MRNVAIAANEKKFTNSRKKDNINTDIHVHSPVKSTWKIFLHKYLFE